MQLEREVLKPSKRLVEEQGAGCPKWTRQGVPVSKTLGPLEQPLREQLDLPDDEGLALVDISAGTVTLARVGRHEAELPEGPAAFSASIESFPLASVLRTLHAGGRSGWLRLCYRDHVKSVWLHQGEVVFATSNQRVDRIGECLLRAGVIQLDMLREAERAFEASGRSDRFGKVLVERGFLTPRELWNGVKYQVEEIVRSLFAYASGQVWFWEGDQQPDNVVRLSLPTARLVEEGLQRSEELAKFLSVLRDPRVHLARVESCNAELAGNERALADAIGTGRCFDEVCEILEFDPTSAARSVQLLRVVGAVKLMRLPDPSGLPELDDWDASLPAAVRQQIDFLSKWISELTSLVAEADGTEKGVTERLARVLDDATGRFPALLTGITLGAGGSLDCELLMSRAAKLPGERDGQLVAALGELAAYLEFEVKNHPSIDDPDGRLQQLRETAPSR